MIIIGHRGACGYERENTIKSFEKAIEIGVDYVELDVQKTVDDEIVVFHDKRTFDNIPIEDISLSRLKQELLKEGIIVPTLDEVLECINGRIGVNMEIKSRMPAGLIIEKIKKYKCDLDKVIVSSFMHDLLLEVKRSEPHIKTGVLLTSRLLDPFDILNKLQSRIIIQNYEFIDKDYIDMLHKGNAEIFVWTVNELQDIKNMIDLKVDGIISDFPDRIRTFKR
ncbi:MAG: glycerophosphodiester phosphodiesterase [Candidatus Omnitrophica bacterium]|nr:glycerophosphodiester phosphodiesterase [Candidatus Omnitrophota bacterium]MBU1997265.1 glycerophosphodiester phosphodiesterase [Candidatus Omnitrophota bacterium]MBU4334193.1 glycerophosphodiester phosphodiesterase [Candidatus Omnitrophota bacterium]